MYLFLGGINQKFHKGLVLLVLLVCLFVGWFVYSQSLFLSFVVVVVVVEVVLVFAVVSLLDP